MKGNDLKHSCAVLIVLALSVSFAGCDDRESVQQLAKLRQIAADTPLYPGFNQIRLSDNNKIGDAILTIYYRSPASYDAVKDFILEN